MTAPRRRSIQVPGLAHGKNPIPLAALIDGVLMSGGLFGLDRATGQLPETPEAQCAQLFDNVAAVLAAAGGGWGDVLRMTFYTRPGLPKELINAHWVQVFPDADSRPARHTLVNEHLPAGLHLQCDLFAVLAPA
jgi:enamine deaminase RidA (YjgF/YER057c/UK114 family)